MLILWRPTDHVLWHDVEHVVLSATACGFRSQLLTLKSLNDGSVVTVLSDNVVPAVARVVARAPLRLVVNHGVRV